VKVASGPISLGSDVHYSREKMRARRLPGILWSPEAMVASWVAVEALLERLRAQLIISHEAAYREVMRLAPDEWYE